MGILLLVALAGFAASLVDGALGMGFGPTSSSILLGAGLAPAAASATVNLAKVVIGMAGGAAHWRFGNVDRRLVLQLAIPGCVGAAVGVTVLANVDGDSLRPWLAAMLIVVGIRILVRFSRPVGSGPASTHPDAETRDQKGLGLSAVALVGGVTNGLIGAWGPVVTPVLLSRKGLKPRVAIGSVNTAEIAVALVASGSLLASLGGAGVEPSKLVAMLIGGVIAAPFAAWSVRHLAPRVLGVGAGGLLLLTNSRELAGWAEVGVGRWLAYGLILAAMVIAGLRPRLRPTPEPELAPAGLRQ